MKVWVIAGVAAAAIATTATSPALAAAPKVRIEILSSRADGGRPLGPAPLSKVLRPRPR